MSAAGAFIRQSLRDRILGRHQQLAQPSKHTTSEHHHHHVTYHHNLG
jgi:hypothetical protein